MKSLSLRRSTFAGILTLVNAIFWLVFGTVFLSDSYAYVVHAKQFEERGPELIFFGRALSYLEHEQMRPAIRTTRLLQWPSFYLASPFNWLFSHRGIVVDHLYGGISVGGYYLVLVCLISFLQWYLVGFFIDYLCRRLFQERKIGSL